MLALQARLARPEARAEVIRELELTLEEWSEQGHGLEPFEPDVLRASTLGLALLSGAPARAEELRFLLDGVDAVLVEAETTDPDLAFAFVSGWRVLVALPDGGGVSFEDRRQALERAQDVARGLDPADDRDGAGFGLALDRFILLSEAGRREDARRVLEVELGRLPSEHGLRLWLLAPLADEHRLAGDFERAWAVLHEAEALCGPDGSGAPRTLVSTRLQLEIAQGLVDRAAETLPRLRARLEPDDDAALVDYLLCATDLALASVRPRLVAATLGELDARLREPRFLERLPEARAQLRFRRALLEDIQALFAAPDKPTAPLALREVYEDPALDAASRVALAQYLAARALRGGDLEELEGWLDRTADVPSFSLEQGGAREALRALLEVEHARRSGVDARGRLEELRSELGERRAELLQSWAKSPLRAGGLGFLRMRSRRLVLEAALELELALEGERGPRRALEGLLEVQALGSLSRRLGEPVTSLEGFEELLLGPRIGLLHYVLGGRRLWLFCADARGVSAHPLEWRFEAERAPGELVELYASSPFGLAAEERRKRLMEFEELARELGARLFPSEVRERMRAWEGAYVVASDALAGIPFECLPFGEQELGERMPLSYLPSLEVGLQLARLARTPQDPPRSGLLLVAAPNAASKRPTIPFGKAERDALTAGFLQPSVLAGDAARMPALLAALAVRPAMLHLVVHGVNDPERELPSGLEFADGTLWCEDIQRDSFASPRLVALSSCGAARGPRRLGDDGLEHLGGAFLSRGARAVILATNDVAFDAGVALMAGFGREVQEARPPAVALFAARRALAQQGRFDDPFYTSSMRVFGLGFAPPPAFAK